MSRNEMFLLLACALTFAILTSSPAPLLHTSPFTISSLFPSGEAGTMVADLHDR